MNILTELFHDFATFSRYAPGVETNMDLNDLQSSGLSARKRIETAISTAVFRAIITEPEGSFLVEGLRSAMANITMATQLIFDSINRRKNDVNLYKYEIEAMKRAYMENYCNALDTIVQSLMDAEVKEFDAASPAALWRQTRYFSILSDCEIKSMPDFDMIYPIDASYLFFFRTVALQKETLDEVMSAYFAKLTDDNSPRVRPMLLLALVDNKAFRHGSTEAGDCLKLADRLDREAEELIANADTLLSTDSVADFCSNSAYNSLEDNIIMLP